MIFITFYYIYRINKISWINGNPIQVGLWMNLFGFDGLNITVIPIWINAWENTVENVY